VIDGDKRLKPCALGHAGNRRRHLHTIGSLPIAGYLEEDVESSRRAPRFESGLVLCTECGLVQQANTEVLTFLSEKIYADYQPTYSISPRVTRHATSLLTEAARQTGLEAGDTVVEVGSNDGHFLRVIQKAGYRAAGFEPSSKTFQDFADESIEVIPTFFDRISAGKYAEERGAVKLLITRHTLEHAFDVVDFLGGISNILRDDGIALIEVPYLHHQMLRGHVESMSFQHRFQFTVGAMSHCLRAAGLHMAAVRFVNFDGGAMVVTAKKTTANTGMEPGRGVKQILLAEQVLKLDHPAGYEGFVERITRTQLMVKELMVTCVSQGGKTCAYGAGGKGQNIINMNGLDVTEIGLVVDDNPEYNGKYIPGTSIPIVSTDQLGKAEFDLLLVSAPTHLEQLMARQVPAFRHAQYVLTVPDFHILSQ
jgi:hypothetical protein